MRTNIVGIRQITVEDNVIEKSPVRLARLDWYDSTLENSADTCGAATPGIMWAFFLYPQIFTLYRLSITQWRDPGSVLLSDWVSGVVLSMALGVLVVFWGILIAAAVTIFVPPLNYLLNFSLSARNQIAGGGCLAGCLGILPWYLPVDLDYLDMLHFYPPIFYVPLMMAVVLGHVCTLFVAGRTKLWLGWAKEKVDRSRGYRPQFALGRIFVLCTVAAVIVAGLNGLDPRLAVYFAIYFVLQSFLLVLDGLYLKLRQSILAR